MSQESPAGQDISGVGRRFWFATWWPWLVVIVLFALALAVRWPGAASAKVDPNSPYSTLAQVIRTLPQAISAEGRTAAEELLWQKPPVLPRVLSWFANQADFFLLQAFLSALLVVPLFLLGRRWDGAPAGLLAAFVWALWGPSVELCREIQPEQLFSLFLVAGLLLLDVQRKGWEAAAYLVAGLCLALAELTRPVLVPFMALAAAYLIARLIAQTDRLSRAAVLVALVIGLALPLAAYHLNRPRGEFAWVYSKKGMTMLTTAAEFEQSSYHIAERQPPNWNQLSEPERENYAFRLFLAKVWLDPVSYASNALNRLYRFWFSGYGSWNTRLFQPSRFDGLLALLGLIVLCRRRSLAFIWSLFLAVDFTVVTIAVFPKPRFRESITAWFLVLVAIGLMTLFRGARSLAGTWKKRRRAVQPT